MKKILCTMLVISITAAMFSGCKKVNTSEVTDIKGAELTYWMPLNSNLSVSVSNFGETKFAKELEKKTGVKITYIHPTIGQEDESFNLMVASGDMADIVQKDWTRYKGGPAAAISEGVITPLNDLIEKNAPNLNKIISNDTDLQKSLKTINGDYYVFPFLKLDKKLKTVAGPVLRQDWLDDLGLDVPETIDEWENVLRAFKNEKGASAPFSFSYNLIYLFLNMFGTSNQMYIKDGKTVEYGPVTDKYKEALTKIAAWYKEGLIDRNIASVDAKMIDSNVLSGITGGMIIAGGSGIGKYLSAATDEKFNLTAAVFPSFEKGKASDFNMETSSLGPEGCAAISAKCKNKEAAARVLDYLYSEEGHRLANFGIENESYTIKDGKAIYTDLITNNPDGKSMSEIMPMYMLSCYLGPFVQDVGYIEQYYTKEQQREALTTWNVRNENTPFSVYPDSASMDETKTNEYSNIMINVSKYVGEMTIKFITGVEPIDNFETYLDTMSKYKVYRAIELKQEAYDNYLNR